MKRLIVLLVILLLPTYVLAGACGDYEYAELQDMDKETLINAYCNAFSTYKKLITQGNILSPRVQADCKSCEELTEKMDRTYKKRFYIQGELNESVQYVCEKRMKPLVDITK